MEVILNESLLPLVNAGKLSVGKLHNLIYIKEFVDRVSTRPYLAEDSVKSLEEKYGVKPSVISWGDYFQTELGRDSENYSDEEFSTVIDTVRFDIMSSCELFTRNSIEFFEWVESAGNEISESGKESLSCDEEEIVHLQILKNYYLDMGLIKNFTEGEILWYNSFSKEAEAMPS